MYLFGTLDPHPPTAIPILGRGPKKSDFWLLWVATVNGSAFLEFWHFVQIFDFCARWVANLTMWVTWCHLGPRGLGRFSGPQSDQVEVKWCDPSWRGKPAEAHPTASERVWGSGVSDDLGQGGGQGSGLSIQSSFLFTITHHLHQDHFPDAHNHPTSRSETPSGSEFLILLRMWSSTLWCIKTFTHSPIN